MIRMTFALVALLVAAASNAATTKTIVETFAVAGRTEAVIRFGVGELNLRTHEGADVEVTVEIEGNDDRWWRKRPDVDHVELESRETDEHLLLRIRDCDCKATWRVKLPERLAIDVHVGVGTIRLERTTRDVDVELGVGEIRLVDVAGSYQRISLDAGVGHTEIRGFARVRDERRLVKSSSTYSGSGKHRIYAEVGVGEVVLSGVDS